MAGRMRAVAASISCYEVPITDHFARGLKRALVICTYSATERRKCPKLACSGRSDSEELGGAGIGT